MPELPEVETVVRALRPHLVGQRITTWVARRGRLRELLPQDGGSLLRQRIDSVERRGKYLLIIGESGSRLIIHLGMTGSLSISPRRLRPDRHEHLTIGLSNGMALRFTDPRRFGLIRIVPPSSVHLNPLPELGPEPLSSAFSGQVLWNSLQGRSGPIKVLLLDQSLVAGIGNIYASEALFRARIHPRRPGNRLSPAEACRLAQALQQTLSDAIEAGIQSLGPGGGDKDASDSSKMPVSGEETHFAQELRVYDRAGNSCRVCGTTIESFVLGGRSTYFCPKCQPGSGTAHVAKTGKRRPRCTA